MLKSAIRVVPALLLGFVIAAATVVLVRSVHAGANLAPFTAQVRSTLYDQNGAVGMTLYETFAVRADGSQVRVRQGAAPDGTPYTVTGLVDIPGKRGVTSDSLTKSITTVNYTDAMLQGYTNVPAGCAADEPNVSAQMLGYPVVKKTSTHQPTGTASSQTELWMSAALNCYPLKRVFSVANGSGSMRVATITEVQSVVLGDPDPSLFVVPAGYTEHSPSEELALRNSLLGRDASTCPTCATNTNSLLDQIYGRQHYSLAKPAN